MEENDNEENYKKDLYKKWIIIIIGIIIIVVSGIGIFNLLDKNNKGKKAEEVFGTENCEAVLHMATMDLEKHTCSICGEEFESSSMREDICDNCSKELGRCNFCGKRLSEEVKEQRNQLLGE